MGYSGTLRSQYRQAGGQAIDNAAERSAFDPSPARVALFTDIDRQQWGMMTDWAHPPHYTAIEIGDAGYGGSPGSYTANTHTVVHNLLVPPRVTACAVGAVISGALNIKLTTSVDTVGVQLEGSYSAGTVGHDNPSAAGVVWGSGVSNQSPLPLSARALAVAANADTAQTQLVPVTIAIKRADLTVDATGSGGVLWGLIFKWVRQPLNTFKLGTDIADSLSV